MGNRRHIDASVKRMVVNMHHADPSMTRERIAQLTGVRPRTQTRARRLVRTTGDVARVPIDNGRPRLLNYRHTDVCDLYRVYFPF